MKYMKIKNILSKREVSAFMFLIFLFVFVGLKNHDFFNNSSISTILKGSVIYVYISIGMTFVLLTGGIDVSVGATLGISAAISASMIRDGKNIFSIILIVLFISIIIGLINGIGVSIIKVPAIIMTLGTMGIIRGIMVIYTNGKWIENLPDSFKTPANQTLFRFINLYFFIALIIVFIIHLYFTKTKTGKYFAAIGDNMEGAVLVGIPVKKVIIIAYVISAISASIAGIIFASQVGFVTSNSGVDLEMTAIAACVLGGVSLSGGIGTVIGSFIGAITMTSINSALVYLKVPSFSSKSIQGTLLILIVVADVIIHKYLNEKARKQRLSARIKINGGKNNE